jgi:hypothetical protein
MIYLRYALAVTLIATMLVAWKLTMWTLRLLLL